MSEQERATSHVRASGFNVGKGLTVPIEVFVECVTKASRSLAETDAMLDAQAAQIARLSAAFEVKP